MKIESYYKGWIPDSSAALPYVCFTIGIVLFMIMFWCLLAFFIVAFKNVMETGLFDPKRLPKKKNKPKKTHERTPEADAENYQPNESGVNNESTAQETEPNVQNADDQPRPEPENDPDAVVSDPEILTQGRPKAKKNRYYNDLHYVMDIIMISQKTFYTVIIFLMLAIMIHLNLLMVESALKSYDLATGLSEKDAAKTVPVDAGKVTLNCCACDMIPAIKKDDKSFEPFFGNGPIEKDAKPMDLYSVNTAIVKGTKPEDPDDLRNNF